MPSANIKVEKFIAFKKINKGKVFERAEISVALPTIYEEEKSVVSEEEKDDKESEPELIS
jgi:hypothetical protein